MNGDKKVDFMYDYLGQRVGKSVQTWSGGAWVNTASHYFLYDGWQVVMVLDGLADPQSQEQVVSKYTWGLDLSSSVAPGVSPVNGGAGGIGGLLAATATRGTTATTDDDAYWFCYDANGNNHTSDLRFMDLVRCFPQTFLELPLCFDPLDCYRYWCCWIETTYKIGLAKLRGKSSFHADSCHIQFTLSISACGFRNIWPHFSETRSCFRRAWIDNDCFSGVAGDDVVSGEVQWPDYAFSR